MSRRRLIATLADHPNASEIQGVLARLQHITAKDQPKLAASHNNDLHLIEARHRALSIETPLIVDLLDRFEVIDQICPTEPAGWVVKDALAAAYAKPIISRSAHILLSRSWRSVFPIDGFAPASELTIRHGGLGGARH